LKDLRAFLRNVYFFKGLAEEEIGKIAQVCHEVTFGPGEVIFAEGSAPDRFYIVAEGAVEVWKDHERPERDLLAVHEPGHLFGEMALIDDLPRSATVIARDRARLFYIGREDFHRIIRKNARIAISILKSVSDIVRRSNENFVESLHERAQELEKANQALREAQEELLIRERLSTLGKFSSLIVHDIRNPLTVLRSLAELVLMHSEEPEKVERDARRIMAEADRLNQITTELLDYSRGEIRLNTAAVDLAAFLKRLVETVRDKFAGRGISIATEVNVAEPVMMDEQRMFRVFLNLADNARKAMPQGGSLTIKAYLTDGMLTIEVSDTGVGMSPDVQKRIFEPFFSSSEQGGTGLGMSIVKSVIEAHRGTVSFRSQQNVGTTFCLSLPLRAERALRAGAGTPEPREPTY
jgi:signal transduction histidine kinase